ncbi:MAG: hypothetical protein LBC61_04765 [Candidatus Peribacteria bacterium]|jgi:hypothetical protein|nr:hypothetical protein [Candidatus Peribacteria bacterium]
MNTVIRSSNIIENFNGLNMRLLNSLYSDPNSDPNIPLNTFKETYKSLISSYSKEVEKKTIEMDKVIKGENFKNGFEKLDIMTLSSIYTISEHIILNSELEEFKKVYGKLLYFNNVLQDGIHSIDIEAVFNSLSIEELQKLYLQISPESKYQRVTFLQEILNKK